MGLDFLKFDEILRAVENRTLGAAQILHYINQEYELDGVRDFLVNRLYNLQDSEAAFYTPELVNLFLHSQKKSVRRYLQDKASRNLSFYLHVLFCKV